MKINASDILKRASNRLFFRSSSFRSAVSLIYQMDGQRPNLSHLSIFPEGEAMGPLQREEALLLFAMCRVLRPAVVVEFGFLRGFSALNFLQALPSESLLASYDISDNSRDIAKTLFDVWPNFRFHHKSQTDFHPGDIDNRPIDLCLIDASHDFDLNVKTFENIYPSLGPSALVFVHDTGLWHKKYLQSDHQGHITHVNSGVWLTEDLYLPRPEEVKFVHYVAACFPDLQILHLHSESTLRHGLTVFQRTKQLPLYEYTSDIETVAPAI